MASCTRVPARCQIDGEDEAEKLFGTGGMGKPKSPTVKTPRAKLLAVSLCFELGPVKKRTPLGLLLGDLCHSPSSILDPLQSIFSKAEELAAWRFFSND